MSQKPRTEPVGDPIAKVNDEVAVGADLEFQKRWWAFERIVWLIFTGVIILDVLGFFGRGPVAQGSSGNRRRQGASGLRPDRPV